MEDSNSEISRGKIKIRVDRSLLTSEVHGSVWRQGQFVWEPRSFVIESPRLENRIVESTRQIESLHAFRSNPGRAMIYCVAGNPDDSRAKYFAAYLAYLHKCKYSNRADIVWEPVYGGFENSLMRKDINPTMLILSNLTENSTNVKLEKARDLIEKFPNIPRVVVCSGEDPISFVSTKLYQPAHGIAYFCSGISKSVQEVI